MVSSTTFGDVLFLRRSEKIDSRDDRSLSQGQLARLLGISRQYISKLELGKTEPSLPTLALICKVLGTTGDQIDPNAPLDFHKVWSLLSTALDLPLALPEALEDLMLFSAEQQLRVG